MYEALETLKGAKVEDKYARTLYDSACILASLGQKIPAIKLIKQFTDWTIPFTKKWVEQAEAEHVERLRVRRALQSPVPAVCQHCGNETATFYVIDVSNGSNNFWCSPCYFSFEANREAQRIFDTYIAHPLWPIPPKPGDYPHPITCSACEDRAAYIHKPGNTDAHTQTLCPWHAFERRRIIRSWGAAPYRTIKLMTDHYDV